MIAIRYAALAAVLAILTILLVGATTWTFKSVSPGDLLGFAGGVLGAGLAVIGSLYVEENKRRKEAKLAAGDILQGLFEVQRYFDETTEEPWGEDLTHVTIIGRPLNMVLKTLSFYPPKNPRVIDLVDQLRVGGEWIMDERFYKHVMEIDSDPTDKSGKTHPELMRMYLRSFAYPLSELIKHYRIVAGKRTAARIEESMAKERERAIAKIRAKAG
jgi:hypothetical protein